MQFIQYRVSKAQKIRSKRIKTQYSSLMCPNSQMMQQWLVQVLSVILLPEQLRFILRQKSKPDPSEMYRGAISTVETAVLNPSIIRNEQNLNERKLFSLGHYAMNTKTDVLETPQNDLMLYSISYR